MTSTEVALIGTAATAGVAVAGYGFNVWRAAQYRKAAKELAAAAQEHELRLAQGSRAYEDRKDAYRRVVAWAVRAIQQVELEHPIVKTANTPEPPEDLPGDVFDAMNTEVRLFGTDAVVETMTEFRNAVDGFRGNVWLFEEMKGQPGSSFQELDRARESARSAFTNLTTTIRDELASL